MKKKKEKRAKKEPRRAGVKTTTTRDDMTTDEEGEMQKYIRWEGEMRACSKLPNYFSSCPRGPGKIIIKTSRGAG